ncbi:MAG: ERF family protein [Clostridiaceae bacterium]|nr:ERF family protein [Clostridiaceae bacterium]
MNVYEKLQQVQSGLKAPKNQYNKFGDYYYRNCEDIQEAAKPLLKEVKAALVVGDELVLIGDRYYIKATARFVDCESSEVVENSAYAREEQVKKGMDVSQVTGSTSSYARKYALNGLFCIDDVKDTDNQDNSNGSGRKPPSGKAPGSKKTSGSDQAEKVSQPMIESVKDLIGKYSSKGLKMEKILAIYKIKDISDMSVVQYKDCMEKLKLYEKEEPKNE